jgi:thiamine-monophosphate kinase
MRAVSSLGEKRLIARLARRIRHGAGVVRGIGDDCAVLKAPKGKDLLFACDMLVEGVHFLKRSRPDGVGWKALAVNVSDIAAMGGLPRHAVVSLGLPPDTPVAWVDGLYRGLRRCARRFKVNLVGGDTDRARKIVVDVAILGWVEQRRAVYRGGAKPGDLLLVTGRLGGAVRSGRHLRFTPRLLEARALAARAPIHAMIDLSDGLGPDLTRLCQAGGVSAEVEAAAIPRARGAALAQALTEGEDFELLMAVSPGDAKRLLPWARQNLPCGLTAIGRVVKRRKNSLVRLIAPRGVKVPRTLEGFRHF